MKKVVFGILMVLLLTGALFAGGSSEVDNSEKTLRVAMCGDGSTKEVLDNLLLGFTEETGIKVETIYVGASWGEFTTKVQTMLAGGEQLDVAYIAVEAIPMFMELGLTVSLEDWIAANPEEANEILRDTNPIHQDSFRDADGNRHAFPFSMNNVVVHFNMNRLEEAGLPLPPPNWTTDDFLEYCEKLTVEKNGVKQYAFALPYTEWFCSEAWLFNNGASFFNEDASEVTINSPEAVEMFTFLQDLVFEYGYAPIPEGSYSAIEQLINGQVAMGSWGRWPTSNYVASNFTDVAIQNIPSMSEQTEIYGVDGFFALESSDYVDDAIALAAYISRREFTSEYLAAANIPCQYEVAETKIVELGIPENNQLFYAALENENIKQVSCPLEFEAVTPIFNAAMSEIFVNNADVQETLDAAAAQIERVM